MMCDALDVNNLIESEGAVKGDDRCSWAVSSGGIYTVTAKKAKMAIPFDHPAPLLLEYGNGRGAGI